MEKSLNIGHRGAMGHEPALRSLPLQISTVLFDGFPTSQP